MAERREKRGALGEGDEEDRRDHSGEGALHNRGRCSNSALPRGLPDCRFGEVPNHRSKGGVYDDVKLQKEGLSRVDLVDEAGEKFWEENIALRGLAAGGSKGLNYLAEGSRQAEHRKGISDCSALKQDVAPQQLGKMGIDGSRLVVGGQSYKEALLLHPPKKAEKLPLKQSSPGIPGWRSRYPVRFQKERRCFRCLARDHGVAACRDPIRCRACWRFGHRERQCRRRSQEKKVVATMNVPRVHRRRARPTSLKSFIPFSEEFIRRADMRENAMLVDIVQPGDLGPAPQQTLATALARRFGGYAHDFFVARYSVHDFAIILPGWVESATLIRRHLVTLDNIWLRCFSWGQYRNARIHRPAFAAWIQLRNVPFECWTAPRIASMVSGFGRFVRADENSKNMTDLRTYRCRIVVDDVSEIPHRLSIILGEEVLAVHVHVESTERLRMGGDAIPPPPPAAGPRSVQ